MENREIVLDIPVEHERNIFGGLDLFLKKIERSLQVDVIARDGKVKILGSDSQTKKAERVLQELLELSKRGSEITEQNVDYIISMTMQEATESYADLDKEILGYTVQGKPIKAKTYGQQKYVRAIQEKMMVFGIGPAGTGKTYLAMAMAISAFKNGDVNRIILTRPAIEAGEKLGFLPGDLQSKIDPYLRPLYDALFDMLGAENFQRCQERGDIEVAPLAYMRGRTLDDSFIILDEAQNTTSEQMKMFLTRLGFGSKAVVTGDITQIDLPDGKRSGLKEVLNILKDVDDIAIVRFGERDVVRHRLVQQIIKAYEKYEERKQMRQYGQNKSSDNK